MRNHVVVCLYCVCVHLVLKEAGDEERKEEEWNRELHNVLFERDVWEYVHATEFRYCA